MKEQPKINSKWVRKDWDGGNTYTVLAVTNTAHLSEKYPPQVIYQGDNGHFWSKDLEQWPGSLIPLEEAEKRKEVSN